MSDGPSDSSELSDRIFRVVASLALLLGVGSGGYTLSSTDDRIRKAEVELQLTVRDERIKSLDSRVRILQSEVQRIDRYGPTTGNAEFKRNIEDFEKRLDALEK